MRHRETSQTRELVSVLLTYLAFSCAMTWPLIFGLARDVPGDLGDSLLNMWILGWGAESLPRLLAGEMSLAEAANANIFHPEPVALAFSEHLFGQVLQILPIFHLTGNLILSYNLLFLSTFALSGLGMYLLVREITGNRAAAFLAGLLFAFVPYRVAQIGHIQSLSSQWMPFALFGFRRYIATSSVYALGGGTFALLMQNWSCGYYLIYFAPFVVLFVAHQVVAHGRVRERKIWLQLSAAAAIVFAGTMPFLALYLEGRRMHALERPFAEIVAFSGDVFGYLTASESLRFAGRLMQAWPKPEGELFLGWVPLVLALLGISVTVRAALDAAKADGDSSWFGRLGETGGLAARALTIVLALVGLVSLIGLLAILFTGGFVTSLGGIRLRATNAPRLLAQLAIVVGISAVYSAKFRTAVIETARSPAGIAAMSLVFAMWLSLGPIAHTRGERIEGIGLYAVLLEYVPGFDGLRVPARYAMIAAVYLAMLAGIGAAWLSARFKPRRARVVVSLLSTAFLVEATFAPMPINQSWGDGAVAPPPRVEPASRAPAVYQRLRTMPDDSVIAEFPFGDPAWELRYVYYSTVHWRRILNGYSGGFPHGYKMRVARLERYATAPDEAWSALRSAGTTHVIVHEAALARGEPEVLRQWLESRGAREMGRFDNDVLYDLQHAP